MPQASTPLRILVADRDDDSRESLAVLLQTQGYEVSTAGDGTHALDAYGREQPAVVVMELDLLTHSGFELARRLRAAGGERLGLVALTSWPCPEHEERALAAGFDHCLMKPTALDDLLLAIHLVARTPGAPSASPRAA